MRRFSILWKMPARHLLVAVTSKFLSLQTHFKVLRDKSQILVDFAASGS